MKGCPSFTVNSNDDTSVVECVCGSVELCGYDSFQRIFKGCADLSNVTHRLHTQFLYRGLTENPVGLDLFLGSAYSGTFWCYCNGGLLFQIVTHSITESRFSELAPLKTMTLVRPHIKDLWPPSQLIYTLHVSQKLWPGPSRRVISTDIWNLFTTTFPSHFQCSDLHQAVGLFHYIHSSLDLKCASPLAVSCLIPHCHTCHVCPPN